MTVRGYPFDTTDAAGSVTELEWRRLMQWITPSGVLRGEDNGLLVAPRAAGANMSVDVATGSAFIVGHYVRSDAVASVAIGDNVTGNPRIDTIVVGLDFVANTASIYCLPGAVAAAPAPAAITQDITSKWEEILGYVYVSAGENVSITAPEISDARHFAEPQAQDLEQVARLATTAALAASTVTGVDRVANANGALANIDGVAPAVGDRILDKDHATGSARGLWRVVDVGSATKPWRMRRSYAADTSAKVRAMLEVRVSEGTVNGNGVWLLTTDDPIVLGTTALTFTKFGTELSTLLTTLGDTVYASAANVLARLGKGAALQVYRMNAAATAPEWATLAVGPDLVRTVVAITTASSAGTGASSTACQYTRVIKGGTITTIGFQVQTQSGNCAGAVCRGAVGRANPTSRVVTSGAVACPAAGYATVSVASTVVDDSTDWLALSVDNTTMTVYGASPIAATLSSNVALGQFAFQQSAHPVPASPAPTAGSNVQPIYALIGA